MTWALCLTCGDVKFGAICPCPNCGVPSTGNIQLDIAFSDHHLSRRTLDELGAVVAEIGRRSSDPELRFWSFIRYVSVQHPSILGVNLKPDLERDCDALLAKSPLPPVTLQESPRAPGVRDDAVTTDGSENGAGEGKIEE